MSTIYGSPCVPPILDPCPPEICCSATGYKYHEWPELVGEGGIAAIGEIRSRTLPSAYVSLIKLTLIGANFATIQPTHVFYVAGVIGRLREKGLILINYATDCIFEFNKDHLLKSGIGFNEDDIPNFIGSFYSKTKAMVSFFQQYLLI
ncbi:hypothetical protein NE237_003321 [Protea cynaroides]|uniref:Uncharacterized protein n=1 Tax=Protea cynaroides TaxID=273540 RepID=A0A9Q0KGS0_9MAGN|nr:hypothetical protein NE237_003321 [Protea cynaroides]